MPSKISNKELEKLRFTQELLEKSLIIQFVWKNEEGWPVEYVSENVEKILLYSVDDFISRKVIYSKIIHPNDIENVTNEVSKYSDTNVNSFEHKTYRIIDKNGNIKWVKDITHIKRNINNEITHYEGIIIDITEQKESEHELKISEEYYKSIMENSSDVISVIDKNGKSIFRSASYEKVMGFTAEEMLGKNIFQFVFPDDKERLLKQLGESIATPNKTHKINFKAYHKDGTLRYLEGSGKNMLASPIVKGIIINYRDITERKKIERAIKESEEKYKNIIENFTDVYYRADSEGKITMVSPSAMEIFRCSSIDEIIGFSIENVYSKKEDRAKFLQKLKKEGRVKNFRTILIRNDGTEVYVETTAKLLLDENNKYIGVEGIVRDISERKEAELALKASNEKYQTVANYTYDWEYWIDTNNNFAYVSPSSERITGYKPKEFYEDKNLMHKIIHPDDKGILEEHKKSFIKKGIRSTLEFRIITKNNKTEWIGHVCQNVFDKKGKFLGIRGNNRLITKRKLVQEQIKKNEIELKELNAAKDKFFSIIAHDLRSPFNSMFGFSELLTSNFDKYDSEKQKKYLNIIHDGIRNTYKLLDDLLLWSRSQQGTMDFNPEKINLFLLTDETCEVLYQIVEAKSIKLINNIPENISVFADIDMLSTILRNLLSNSIKFTKKGGRIIVDAIIVKKGKNGSVQISIKDNGIGIPKEKQVKLFDIRENTSTAGTENETGTGLGLILCKEFVEKHNGKIWFESEVNIGTTFYFTIL